MNYKDQLLFLKVSFENGKKYFSCAPQDFSVLLVSFLFNADYRLIWKGCLNALDSFPFFFGCRKKNCKISPAIIGKRAWILSIRSKKKNPDIQTVEGKYHENFQSDTREKILISFDLFQEKNMKFIIRSWKKLQNMYICHRKKSQN